MSYVNKPLTWEKTKNKGSMLPFRVVPNRVIFGNEMRELETRCGELFGPRFLSFEASTSPSQWSNERTYDSFSFRTEESMAMFVMMFTGFVGGADDTYPRAKRI